MLNLFISSEFSFNLSSQRRTKRSDRRKAEGLLMGKMLHFMKFNQHLVRRYRPRVRVRVRVRRRGGRLSPASRPPLLLPHSEV